MSDYVRPFYRRQGVRQAFIGGVLLLGLTVLVAWGRGVTGFWEVFAVAALGSLVAVAELIARYRDDPAGALISLPAVLYVLVNAVAAIGALYLILEFGWTFGANTETVTLTQVLTAGFGSAALFRSSLFNVTAGDQVIGIGPSAVLNVILAAADRAVDRQRALTRSELAAEIMADFSFARSADALAHAVSATMQNITAEEAKVIEQVISALRDPKRDSLPDPVKAYVFGMCLLTVTGPQVLRAAARHVVGATPQVVAKDTEKIVVPESLPPEAKRVIEALMAGERPQSVTDLQRELSIDFRTMGEVLAVLEEGGFVRVNGARVGLAA